MIKSYKDYTKTLKLLKSKITINNFTTNSEALDKNGNNVDLFDPAAKRWSADGAVDKLLRPNENSRQSRRDTYDDINKMLKCKSLELFNLHFSEVSDNLGFESIHKILDSCIADEELRVSTLDTNFKIKTILKKSLDDANKLIPSNYIIRVISEWYETTEDLNLNRINAKVNNGIITEVYYLG